jgi:HAMP domain-containing protein
LKILTNLTLWKKITILTTFGLALGVAVFSTVGMRAVNEANEAMLQDRLTTAHMVADYVDETLVLAVNELKSSGKSLETDGLNSDLGSLMDSMQERYSQLSIYTRGIYLIDENGQVIYSKAEAPVTEHLDLSQYSDVAQAIENNQSVISRMVLDPETDTPVIFLTNPVTIPQDAMKHAMVVSIDLAKSRIGVFVRPLRLGQTGYVEIVDQNGIVVARTEPGPKLEPFEKSDHSGRFVALIDAGKPTRGICHTCHEPQQKVKGRDVLAFVPLSSAHWGVVVRQSETEALAPAYKLRQNLIFYGLGLVSVALLFVFITTRDVGSRIQILTSASRRIANGDLTSPVSTLGRDEVGTLAQTFDDMRSKLKTSYGNLEQRTELTSSYGFQRFWFLNLIYLTLDTVVAKAMEIIPYMLEFSVGAEDGKIAVQCAIGLMKTLFSMYPFHKRFFASRESQIFLTSHLQECKKL